MRSATRMSRACGNVSDPSFVVYSIYCVTQNAQNAQMQPPTYTEP
jgi:hypothetical protein